jgi:hypothetical protein
VGLVLYHYTYPYFDHWLFVAPSGKLFGSPGGLVAGVRIPPFGDILVGGRPDVVFTQGAVVVLRSPAGGFIQGALVQSVDRAVVMFEGVGPPGWLFIWIEAAVGGAFGSWSQLKRDPNGKC